jgi:hypothetical protein
MSKEKTIKLNEKQQKIVKDLLQFEKKFKEIGIKTTSHKNREDKIQDIREIEDIEKQLDK